MNDKELRLTCAVSGCFLGLLLVVLFNYIPLDDRLAKCLVDKDSGTGEPQWFSVQLFMWIAFGIGIGELMARMLITNHLRKELTLHLLPDEDMSTTLERSDMGGIHARVAAVSANGLLAKMITLLASQFQSTHSVSDCHECLNTQADLNANRCTTQYGSARYITWLIPSLGFIGTVYGILEALDIAQKSQNDMAAQLPNVIGGLSVAFWTTLLALIMCCVLMFLQHIIQSREEEFQTSCCEYCLRNFINRLVVVDDSKPFHSHRH